MLMVLEYLPMMPPVDETVPAIAYLLSDESGAVTGQNIGITGGVR